MWTPMPLPTAHDPLGSHCQKQVIRRRLESGSGGGGGGVEEELAVGSRGAEDDGEGVVEGENDVREVGSWTQKARRETWART